MYGEREGRRHNYR